MTGDVRGENCRRGFRTLARGNMQRIRRGGPTDVAAEYAGVRRIASAANADFGRRGRSFPRRGYRLSARNAKQGQVSPGGLPESDTGGSFFSGLVPTLGNSGDVVAWRGPAGPRW